MKPLNIIIYLSVIFQIACSSSVRNRPVLELDPRYEKIETYSTFANCVSAAGHFTTEIQATKKGHCTFIQNNSIDSTIFITRLTESNEGFILDEQFNVIDTLSAHGIEMIRGHEIHRLFASPASFYTDISFDKTVKMEGLDLNVFNAMDGLENPIFIYNDPVKQRIKKIELVNPLDISQTIEIVANTWMNTEFGKMPKEVDIIQAKKDTYNFNFIKVEINK